jgi:hypothetical protein
MDHTPIKPPQKHEPHTHKDPPRKTMGCVHNGGRYETVTFVNMSISKQCGYSDVRHLADVGHIDLGRYITDHAGADLFEPGTLCSSTR